MDWFTVDKEGLAKLLEQRGKSFALLELLQNSWDQNVTRVDVRLTRVPKSPNVQVVVEDDDPDGFKDLSHAFTLFAESTKKGDPEKRGRFNLGEKLVLACCSEARIESTTGTVVFGASGRYVSRAKRPRGSVFIGTMRMSDVELAEARTELRRTLPPACVLTCIDGEDLPCRIPSASWTQVLMTEVADGTGYLRRLKRETTVEAYGTNGQPGWIYEMGIPVVETSDAFDVNVMQKVPLTLDRTNVPPSYLREIRVGLLNNTADLLATKEAATATWVKEASGHKDVANSALTRVMDLRFGERRVAYDPSDPEANNLAVVKGYTVVHGGSLSAEEWQNVRTSGIVQPAGQVTPSPKPFSPDGAPLKTLSRDQWSAAWHGFEQFVNAVAEEITVNGEAISLVVVNDGGWGHRAACGPSGVLYWNVATEGRAFFDYGPTPKVLALLIHELAHLRVSNHLSSEFYDECCRLGAELALAVGRRPELAQAMVLR